MRGHDAHREVHRERLVQRHSAGRGTPRVIRRRGHREVGGRHLDPPVAPSRTVGLGLEHRRGAARAEARRARRRTRTACAIPHAQGVLEHGGVRQENFGLHRGGAPGPLRLHASWVQVDLARLTDLRGFACEANAQKPPWTHPDPAVSRGCRVPQPPAGADTEATVLPQSADGGAVPAGCGGGDVATPSADAAASASMTSRLWCRQSVRVGSCGGRAGRGQRWVRNEEVEVGGS